MHLLSFKMMAVILQHILVNHAGRDLIRTAALELLERTPISVDKMHFKNHVADFCRKTMNPYENKCVYHLLVVFEVCYFAIPVCA